MASVEMTHQFQHPRTRPSWASASSSTTSKANYWTSILNVNLHFHGGPGEFEALVQNASEDESAKLKAEMLHYLIVHAENRINKMCYHIIMPLTQPVLHTEGQELVNRWALGSNRKLKSWNFSAAFLQPTNGSDGVGVSISVTLPLPAATATDIAQNVCVGCWPWSSRMDIR